MSAKTMFPLRLVCFDQNDVGGSDECVLSIKENNGEKDNTIETYKPSLKNTQYSDLWTIKDKKESYIFDSLNAIKIKLNEDDVFSDDTLGAHTLTDAEKEVGDFAIRFTQDDANYLFEYRITE